MLDSLALIVCQLDHSNLKIRLPFVSMSVVAQYMGTDVSFYIDHVIKWCLFLHQVDHSKINVINWLVFEDSQRAEAIRQGNALIRQFLGECMLVHRHQYIPVCIYQSKLNVTSKAANPRGLMRQYTCN